MQVVELNAGFVGMFISCAALIFCILIGIFYAHEANKKITQLKKKEAAKLKYQQEMEKIHIADAVNKAVDQAYERGYEDGYHQAVENFKKGQGEKNGKSQKFRKEA